MMVTKTKNRVLVVDDEDGIREVIAQLVAKQGFEVSQARNVAEAMAVLDSQPISIVVSDIVLPDQSGLSLIPKVTQAGQPRLIIFMTGHGSLDTAVNALSQGAFDYLSKGYDLNEMESELKRVLDRAQDFLATRIDPARRITELPLEVRCIIGEAPSMVRLYRSIAKASQSMGNVLILGESGTGKELVAHAIHDNGLRTDEPFVAVNCSALTETLLESELFGHVRGAFTGAISNKRGLFEEADGGTLFLDEIGDISLGLQVKLLRAIQEGEIKPVGANENHKVNVRIIAATHRDLQLQIEQGTFREDLYYRLKVFLLDVPPLRERKEDIPTLVNYFVGRLRLSNGRKIDGILPSAMDLLTQYSWPGNIRELENAIERAAGMTSTNILCPDDFMLEERKPAAPADVPLTSSGTLDEVVERVESQHIARVLESVKYNKSKAAGILNIDRGTLYRKAQQYGIALSVNSAGSSDSGPDDADGVR